MISETRLARICSKQSESHCREQPAGHTPAFPSSDGLAKYLSQRGVKVKRTKPQPDDRTVLLLDRCPMNPEHGTGTDTAIIWRPGGRIGFECKHNSCAQYKWSDVRAKIDPAFGSAAQGTGTLSQAGELVTLADRCELFCWHDDAYATIPVDQHHETYRLKSAAFRSWLTREFYRRHKKPPGGQALQDALNVLAAKATHEGRTRPVFIRIGEAGRAIFIDLADKRWRAVRITSRGWRIVQEPKVRFIRPRGMRRLPVPKRGGALSELRTFLNVEGDDQWILVLAWLVAAIRPRGPYVVLVVNGEQGSAKTTLCRMLRGLIDPNVSPSRTRPRDERDLMIAAGNAWILTFDNLSHLPDWFSDALCRLATGGGFSTRALYHDDEERIFDATRPVMLNGIEDLATRPDLLDRTVCLTLPAIPEGKRQAEAELWKRFKRAAPRILGALFDAVAAALANIHTLKLPKLPRMADFARWAVAAEPALGVPAGSFMAAYWRNIESAVALTIEASSIGPGILSFMTDVPRWQGTASELLSKLERRADESTQKQRDWPKRANVLSGQLRRIAPSLRRCGIDVQFSKAGKGRRRIIVLERDRETSSASSRPSASRAGKRGRCGRNGR